MNPSSDTEPRSIRESPVAPSPPVAPTHWIEALISLITARLALIQLEAKGAITGWVKRIALIAAAAVLALFAWGFLVAGGISWIAEKTDWSWGLIALGGGALHLIIGGVLIMLAKSPAGGAFSVTRSEFIKDREWIKTLQQKRKSNG